MKGIRWRSASVRLAVKLAMILGATALVAHAILGSNGLFTYLQKRRQYSALQRQIQQMNQENQGLQKEVQELKSDPAAIERRAREDLHMARRHEKIYILPRQDSDPAAADLNRQPPNPPPQDP